MLVPEIIKKINSNKVVIKYGNDYVLLSYAPAREDGYPQYPETLAFLCNEDGEVKSWTEVAGGSSMTIADVITEISRFGITKRGAYQ